MRECPDLARKKMANHATGTVLDTSRYYLFHILSWLIPACLSPHFWPEPLRKVLCFVPASVDWWGLCSNVVTTLPIRVSHWERLQILKVKRSGRDCSQLWHVGSVSGQRGTSEALTMLYAQRSGKEGTQLKEAFCWPWIPSMAHHQKL